MLLPGKTLLCIAQSSGEGSRERTFIAVGDIPHEQIAFYVSLLLRKKGSSRSHLQQSFFGRAFHVKKDESLHRRYERYCNDVATLRS